MNTTFVQALHQALAGERLGGFDVSWHESLDSTNDTALLQEFASQPAAPMLVGTDVQLKGRGRRGRAWVSEQRSDPRLNSVTMSLIFERSVQAQLSLAGYSLVVGWALVQALQEQCSGLMVKWPNDVQKHGRKCAGILIETRRHLQIERVVVGIGLNLWLDSASSALIDQPVASLFDTPQSAELRVDVIAKVAAAQWRAWQRFCDGGFAAFQQDWIAVDALAGRTVQVLADPLDPGSVKQVGKACGVAADGALLLETVGSLQTVYAGEVSVRAVA